MLAILNLVATCAFVSMKSPAETSSISEAHREADVLFSNYSPRDSVLFVENENYEGLFENDNFGKQICVNFFL